MLFLSGCIEKNILQLFRRKLKNDIAKMLFLAVDGARSGCGFDPGLCVDAQRIVWRGDTVAVVMVMRRRLVQTGR